MRNVLLKLMLLAVIVAGVSVAQQRTDDFDAAALALESVVVVPQPDGGCAASWCSIVSVDGGAAQRACTRDVELKATVNVNRCQALAAAGTNRLLRELRFDVDGGAP